MTTHPIILCPTCGFAVKPTACGDRYCPVCHVLFVNGCGTSRVPVAGETAEQASRRVHGPAESRRAAGGRLSNVGTRLF